MNIPKSHGTKINISLHLIIKHIGLYIMHAECIPI